MKAAEQLLRIPTAAARLDVSPDTVYRLIASGELAVVDVSGTGSTRPKSRVSEAELARYITSRTRRAGDVRKLRTA